MDAFEMAKKYYPRLWGIDRLMVLVGAGKLGAEDFQKLTGTEYKE